MLNTLGKQFKILHRNKKEKYILFIGSFSLIKSYEISVTNTQKYTKRSGKCFFWESSLLFNNYNNNIARPITPRDSFFGIKLCGYGEEQHCSYSNLTQTLFFNCFGTLKLVTQNHWTVFVDM